MSDITRDDRSARRARHAAILAEVASEEAEAAEAESAEQAGALDVPLHLRIDRALRRADRCLARTPADGSGPRAARATDARDRG